MTEEMLEAAGIPGKEGRFPEPPTTTYAVYFSDVTADGPDGYNCLFTHNDTVELYEPKKEDAAPSAFEAELDARGIHWTKQPRYWLQSVQRYQTIYEYSYIEKRGI